MDSWGAYNVPRERLLASLSGLGNAVVLTGDEHQNFAGELRRDAGRGEAVAVEFVATSISSGGDGADARAGADAIDHGGKSVPEVEQRPARLPDLRGDAGRVALALPHHRSGHRARQPGTHRRDLRGRARHAALAADLTPSLAGPSLGPRTRTPSTATRRGVSSVSKALPRRRKRAITSGAVTDTHQATRSTANMSKAFAAGSRVARAAPIPPRQVRTCRSRPLPTFVILCASPIP